MTDAELVRIVDALEERAESYVTLDEVQAAIGSEISRALDDHLLLVDYRTRADGTRVTLCRLNRRHPLVQQMASW